MIFRLIKRVESYEHIVIEAESREKALEWYDDGEGEWKEDYTDNCELILIIEQDERGAVISQHPLEEGEFTD